MPGTVVITRPLAQARPLAGRVAALGMPVELLPLLDIEPLPDQSALLAAVERLCAPMPGYAMVAFVSPNAIDAAFAHIKQWPTAVTLAVLGEGSRMALAAHGITPDRFDIVSPADNGHSDSEHLLQTLDLAALQNQPVLIIRGESGRELMADGLRAAGANVDVVAAYRRSVPRLTPELEATLRRLLGQQAQPAQPTPANDWVITSSEALRGLCALLAELDRNSPGGASDYVVAMQQQHLIVPHARIAETARDLGFSRLTLTGSGDERLLAALQSRL
jgi:uroporphyrinogen-III synthase